MNEGFVFKKNGKFYIDKRRKLKSIFSNTVILESLIHFLKTNYNNDNINKSILDIGSATKPYYIVYKNYFSDCYSFDFNKSFHKINSINFYASAMEIPLKNETMDCIICTEVLEHVPEPYKALNEIKRVLKINGKAFISTPLLHPLHEMPYDFYRFTPSGIKYLAETAGLEIRQIIIKGDLFIYYLRMAYDPIVRISKQINKTIKYFYHPYNPIIYLTVVVPQLISISYWKKAHFYESNKILKKVYTKLSSWTLGYVWILTKKNE